MTGQLMSKSYHCWMSALKKLQPKRHVVIWLAIPLALIGSFFTTRADGFHGWMPLFSIPVYFIIVAGTLRLAPKSHKLEKNFKTQNFIEKSQQRSKRDLLLLLRFFAASLVFTMHSRIVFGESPQHLFGRSSWFFYSPAWLGMAIFFTLSGYLMGKVFATNRYSVNRSGIHKFYVSRFLRIVPSSCFVTLILLTYLYPAWWTNLKFVLRIFTFTFNGINGPGGFGAFWSLTTEMQFYMLVPALALICKNKLKNNKMIIIALIVAYALGSGIRLASALHYGGGFKYWNPYIYTPLYENLDLFLGGFLLSQLDLTRFQTFKKAARSLWPLLLVITYLFYDRVSWLATVNSKHLAIGFFIVLLPGVASIMTLILIIGMEHSSSTWKKESRFWAPIINYLGPLTFCYYMLHSSIMISIQQTFPNFSYIVKLLISLPLVLALSSFVYYGIESKFHKSSK